MKTTTPPEGEAPVEPYFSGIAGPDYSVSLIWRAHVPDEGELLWPRASDKEAVEVPIGEARDAFGEQEDLRRVSPDGVTVQDVARDDLRPGDTIVLPCDRGLLDEFGWDPSSTSPVVDISILEHGLPLDAAALQRLCGITTGALIDRALGISEDHEEIDEAERSEALEEILTVLTEATPQGWQQDEWQDLLAALDRQVLTARKEVPRLARRSVVQAGMALSDELDEVSLTETAVLLDPHCQAVARRARQIADRLGLPDDVAQVLERSGSLHDIGKADPRFQRWLDPEESAAGVKVAKSDMPRHLWNGARAAAGWPAGGRHEELSARLVRRWLELRPSSCNSGLQDLLLHLVISHHGSGRPLLPPVEDATSAVVAEMVEGNSWKRRPTSPSSTGINPPGSGACATISALGDWPCSRRSCASRTTRSRRAPTSSIRRCADAQGDMPGLRASWLNGWLAAVGATVLDSRIRLHWTEESTPAAVLSAEDTDPVEAIVASWPTEALLADLPIRLPRNPPVREFAERARVSRNHRHSWALSSTLTDLSVVDSKTAHAPFDPPAPKGSTMTSRLLRIHGRVQPTKGRLMDSFMGQAVRIQDNGLGFDLARLGSQSDDTEKWTDPVVEMLAFFGLAILPMRGAGTDMQRSRMADDVERQRGWRKTEGADRKRRFLWPAWRAPLDWAGVDALMDIWEPGRKRNWPLTTVHAAWQSVSLKRENPLDPTRGYGSERL